MRKTWTCARSGDCCRLPASIVMTHAERDVLEGATDRILHFRPHSDARFVEMQAGPCPLLDTMPDGSAWCSVWTLRPYSCRRYGCFRDDCTEPADVASPVPLLVLQSPTLRREYKQMQSTAQRWAVAHGWPTR